MTSFHLSVLDVLVLIGYLAVIILIGVRASRGETSAESYFLASRSSRWPTVGLSLLASNISSTTLIGLAGASYAIGISVYNYEWMAGVVLVVFCIFFLPIILRSGIYTMPEFLEKRYDLATRLYFSALTIFLNIVVDAAGTLFGGSLMFKLIVPSAPVWMIAAVLAACSGIYTVAGGLRAVIKTEVIQAVVLLSTSAATAFAAFHRAGGWSQIVASIPPDRLSLIRPLNSPGVPWVGLLTGVPIVGFYFWCTNQFMVQRILSAKTIDHGRWGALFAGFLKLPVLFFMVLPGSAALLIYPHLPRPDLVYPTLVFDLLPAGLVGLVTAAFLGAVMSATASTFNSASTLVTMDFVARFRRRTSPAALVMIGRIATLVFIVVAVIWVPVVEAVSQTLWQYLQAILAYAVPPIVALFGFGVLWQRANAIGARWGLAAGLACGVLLFWTGQVTHLWPLHFLLAGGVVFVAASVGVVVGSLASEPPDMGRIGHLVWRPNLWTEESALLRGGVWWQSYRLISLGLLAFTATIIWRFR